MPYLLGAGRHVAEEASKKLGAEAWECAQALWRKLWPSTEDRPAAREAITELAKAPGDDRIRGAVEWQLAKLLADNQALAAELRQIMAIAQNSGVMVTHGGVIYQGDLIADRGGMIASRDINISTLNDSSGLSLITRATGFSRFLIIVGLMTAFAGFVSWGYPIVSAVSEGFSSDSTSPPDFQATPWLPLGAGLFVVGALCYAIGLFTIRHRDH